MLLLFCAGFISCQILRVSSQEEGCKIRTYTNYGLTKYVRSRFPSTHPVRVAIIPFDVPETFAPLGNSSLHFGRELARKFQLEIKRTGELPIVELFNRDSWPGKREDFTTGNYGAMKLARDAGYDLVIVGQFSNIKNDSTLELFTKVIDAENAVTIWDSRILWISNNRELNKVKAFYGLDTERPDIFNFPERSQDLIECNVRKLFTEETISSVDTKPKKEIEKELNLDPVNGL